MKTKTAERCIMECHRFIKIWEAFVSRASLEAAIPDDKWRNTSHVRDWLDYSGYCGKERAALRRASLDLSNALADLRQGR